LELLPTDPKRPIVLVGALNGSGKTTVIEALQLALYGKRAAYGWRGAGAYPLYLEQIRNRHAHPTDLTAAEVTLCLADGRRLRIRRQWSFIKPQPREYLAVYLNGSETPDLALSENWDEEVERLLPARLSQLFFFDGERIEKLADPAQSAEVLRSAVASLLGLDLVDHLMSDLDILRTRQKQRLLSDADQALLQSINAQFDATCQEREDLLQQQAALKSHLDRARAEQEAVERRTREQGGERFKQREQLATEVAREAARLEGLEQQLRATAAGVMPLSVISPLLVQLREETRVQVTAGDPRGTETLQKHLVRFGKWVDGRSFSGKVKKELHDYLDTTLRKLSKRLSGGVLAQWEDLGRRLDSLLNMALEEARAGACALLEQHGATSEKLHKLQEQLAQVPEQEQLVAILKAQGAAEATVAALNVEVAQLQQKMQGLERGLQLMRHQRGELLDRSMESSGAARTAEYCQRAIKTLATFRANLVQRRREQLEQLILEAFKLLSRKSDLVGKVKLDNETMAISLLAVDGRPLVTQQLSAGERQLLAVAMLWGLARASGRPIPVVIDTPLGRLDGEHRRTLVERYFPDASHQVILLSTDQEVDADFSQLLDDSVAHRYLIDYNENMGSSAFSTGYF